MKEILADTGVYVLYVIIYFAVVHLFTLISRLPPNVFPQLVSDYRASYWKSFAYPVGILNTSMYPMVTFIVSNDMRAHCCGKFRCHCGTGDAA